MGGWDPARLVELIISLKTIWLILWLGLMALSFALLLLMRTRWGQSKPIHKCAVLSLLAHVLLACFATTIKIVSDSAGDSGSAPVYVNIAAADDGESDPQTERSTKQARPWEPPAGEAIEPPGKILDRPNQLSPTDLSDRQATATSKTRSRITAQTVSRRTDQQPEAGAVVEAEVQRRTPGQSAIGIERPAPQRQDSPSVATPSASLGRRDGAESDSVERRTASINDDQGDTQDRPNATPRLADVARSRQPEEAVPSTSDLLSQASSPTRARPAATLGSAADIKSSASAVASGSDNPPSDTQGAPESAQPEVAAAAAGKSVGVTNAHELPKIYSHRIAPDRKKLAHQRGGGKDTEAAVEAALQWLAANQNLDGRWIAGRHGAGREQMVHGHNRQGAGAQADTGITGLALLTFLAAGHTHLNGKYAANVRSGLVFLINGQKSDGSLAGNSSLFARMYCHGMATFALCEAYAMSGDQRLEPSVRAAIAFSLACQRPRDGGWRYQPGDVGDTSQLGWQAMAIKSADLAGVRMTGQTRMRMMRFLESVSGGKHGGLARYQIRRPVSRAMTAEALFCRQLLGDFPSSLARQEATNFLLEELPGQKRANLYYWYYATLALYQYQDASWNRWNKALKKTLLESQRHQGDLIGSWDPDTVWGGYGGRVYSTSMATLSLEVYYRYLPLYAETVRVGRLRR